MSLRLKAQEQVAENRQAMGANPHDNEDYATKRARMGRFRAFFFAECGFGGYSGGFLNFRFRGEIAIIPPHGFYGRLEGGIKRLYGTRPGGARVG